MFFTINKLESRLEVIESLRYDSMTSIFPLKAWDDVRDRDEVVQIPPIKGAEFEIKKHDLLVGRDRYIWAEKIITLPSEKEGYNIVGCFNLGETEGGFCRGFESLLYVDGVPYQGVDTFHHEVFFEDSYSQRETQLQFLLWSGIEGGGEHRDQIMYIQQAEVGYLHKSTDEFYYIAKNIIGTYKILPDGNPMKEKLLDVLNCAFNQIDVYDSKYAVYGQIDLAYRELLVNLEAIGKNEDVTVHCIGHSHIDVAWLWRVKHSKEKCLRSFSTVLRLMEQFDEYYFIQSQPQLYKFVKENYPEFYHRLKKKVEDGTFEANGGMWVEADCNISSGESLVRQFLYGINFFKNEFGKQSDCLWLPDVFGYSWALPQILNQCNIKTFMTTKISWNEYNKIPHDTFIWRGMDGTEILTHFITTPNENNPDHYTYFTYNGKIEPYTIQGVWENYKDKSLSKDIALSFGWGDGGGGPTRDMLMNRRALDKIPGVPNTKTSTASKYFAKLHENIEQSEGYKHTWVGELYFENHRGTYTSQAYNKRMNRKMEFAVGQMEALGVLNVLAGGEYNREGINKIWELLLINQFHDIIPGSSITEVYEDSKLEYEYCESLIENMKEKYEESMMKVGGSTYSLYNPTSYDRLETVFINESRDGRFTDDKGCELQSQKIRDGYALQVPMIPTGFTRVEFVGNADTNADIGNEIISNNVFKVSSDGLKIETPFYDIVLNASGQFMKLYDKENNREVLKGFGNRLTAYEDIPIELDAWNIDITHFDKYEVIDNLVNIEVLEIGELELAIAFEYKYRDSKIVQIMKCYRDSRRIDFETKADWHESHKLLKTCFEVDVFATKATYDIQFGNLERNTHFSTSWDYAKFEVAAHKWVDLSETGYGVALLNDCKYGHSIRDNLMSISLIKCATWPDTLADQGEHVFTYAIFPHANAWHESNVQVESEFLNQSVLVFKGDSAWGDKSLFRISIPNISIDAIKIAEDGDGVILRLHEYMGKRGAFTIESDFNIESYQETNMLEEAQSDVIGKSAIEDHIMPYQIKNYRVRML